MKLFLPLFVLACGTAAVPGAPSPEPTAEVAIAGPVARVVFIGQDEACDCTRARIDGVDAALAAALAGRAIPVDRYELDDPDDRAVVEEHQAVHAFQVAPAVFFFDADGRLVDMTQGEVEQEALAAILNG